MRAVNLLPKDEARSSRGLPSPWVMLSATVPVIAGTLVYFGYSSEHSKVTEGKAELAIVQAQIDKLNSKQSTLQAQSVLVGLRSTRESALQDALSKSVAWDVTLTDLARVLPPGVALTSLNAQSPTPAGSAPTSVSPAPAASGAGLTLQGTAHDHGQIAEMLERLSLLPMLSNVTLGTTSTAAAPSGISGQSGPPQVSFQVSATIEPTQPSAAP